MDNVSLIRIEAGDLDDAKTVLTVFIDEYKECYSFQNLEKDNVHDRFWIVLFKLLLDPRSESVHELCLKCVRMLSRDKTNIDKFVNEEKINLLLKFAALIGPNVDKIGSVKDFTIIIEALKCLCNLAFNSTKVQTICCNNGTLDGVVRRLRMHPDTNLHHSVKYFDVKLLFILSALSPDIRPRLKEELHALTYLMEALDFILKEGGGYSHDNQLQYFPYLDDNAVELSCEILKVLFNLTIKVLPVGTEEDDERADRLITILRELLLSSTPPHLEETLHRQIINLLTNLPVSSYEMLMPQEEVEYNWEAIDVIVNFLDNKLSSGESKSFEALSPVLMVLIEGARNHRVLRKHVRNRVLPPLRNVKSKPDDGETIRNKLCRLLTGINTKLRDAVAEFLFVLCKKNVGRMIKYTGFGNAAGMFASRNLLAEAVANPEYSSDSENSETEEFREYKDQINPVVGCVEPKRTNTALESMTEEQKEVEVMKLVHAMDKLHREGIIQPCRIGEDGRPQPVEHVLQLQEELPKQQL